MIVLLYNIRSVFNVASIFRTSDALGCAKIYLCGITPGPVDRFGRIRENFIKVSLGAEKSVLWEQCKNTEDLLAQLKKDHFLIAVEQHKNSIPYYALRFDKKRSNSTVLIMGAEVDGLPESILNKVHTIAEIPQKGIKESLNVAIAFGIVGYHIQYN